MPVLHRASVFWLTCVAGALLLPLLASRRLPGSPECGGVAQAAGMRAATGAPARANEAAGGAAARALAASGRCYALERACLHAGGVVLQAHPTGHPLPVLDPG